jgi:hypothetical protein
MAVAIILLLVAVASVLFHVFSSWWWTPLASNWRYIDDTITLTFWITGAVFFAVVAFMAYCVFRFRHTEGRRAAYNPENKKLEWWLSVGTAIGVAAMLAPGLVVWHQFVTVPADATEVEVMGQQWQWSYRLPGKDGRLGTSDARNVSSDNPMGLNPDDPAGQDDALRKIVSSAESSSCVARCLLALEATLFNSSCSSLPHRGVTRRDTRQVLSIFGPISRVSVNGLHYTAGAIPYPARDGARSAIRVIQ